MYFYLPSYFRMENYELRFNWYPYTGEEAPMPLEDIEIISDDEEEEGDDEVPDFMNYWNMPLPNSAGRLQNFDLD